MSNVPNDGNGARERLLGGMSLSRMASEWWEELLWPRVLGAARLGLRPGRLGLALFAVLAVLVLGNVGAALDRQFFGGGQEAAAVEGSEVAALEALAASGWRPAEGEGFESSLWRMFVTMPKRMVLQSPLTMIVFGPLALAVAVVLLGAISRMAASEASMGQMLTWTEGLGFSVQRWRSLLGAVLGPLVMLWLIALVLGVGGFVLMRWPVVNLLGAVLYGLFLLAGFVAALIGLGYVAGKGMLIPAVMCEGTDAIDAIQRVYTYFFARPLRLIVYLALGVIGVVVVVVVVSIIVQLTIGFAARGAAAWAGGAGYRMVWMPTVEALSLLDQRAAPTGERAGTFAIGSWLIRLWTLAPVLIVFAAWLSCGISMFTMVYLAMRRVCDGQDVAELWTPGLVPGTMSEAMAGRERVTAAAGVVATTEIREEADYR